VAPKFYGNGTKCLSKYNVILLLVRNLLGYIFLKRIGRELIYDRIRLVCESYWAIEHNTLMTSLLYKINHLLNVYGSIDG